MKKECCGKTCAKCEEFKRKRRRQKALATAFDWIIKWVLFVVIVVALVLIARLIGADPAIVIAGGALGCSWFNTFIKEK